MDLLTVLLCSWLCFSLSVKAEDKVLTLLGLHPLSGAWSGGPAMKMAVDMALEDINQREDVLPGYQLNVVWEDTKCHRGVSVNSMYKQLYRPPQKIMILGAACSPATEATAIASHLWNLVQLSYLSTSPTLSDKSKFPLFFRLSAPRQQVNPTRIEIMKALNWNRVATIDETLDLFSMVTKDLTARLRANKMAVITSEVFSDDPSEQVMNLKRHDARIIVSGCYQDKVYKLFCEIYRQGLYGPKYVWVVTGFYEDEWWKKGGNYTDCTVEQITEAAEGAFGTTQIYFNHEETRGIGGQTPGEFMRDYQERMEGVKQLGMEYGPLVYDTVWTAALALNNTQQLLKNNGLNKSLEDFTYEDKEMSNAIKESMFDVEFQGLKGWVKFDENGDDTGALVIIRRIQGGVRQIVGLYDQVRDVLEWSHENPLVWQGGHAPADSTTHTEVILLVDDDTYIVMCFLAGMGIILSIVFGAFNIIFREERLIKMSSPRMNNVIIVGCMVTYSTVFLQERSNNEVSLHCKIRTCTLMVGFSLAFGALFAKTWRVYAIFMKRTKKVIIRDEQLFLLVALIVGTDVVILVTREIFDPMVAVSTKIGTMEHDGGDVVVTNLVWVCTSQYDIYFKGAIYTIKGLLLIFGAFLAWQTRKVKIPALNDSHYIGVCIYNVAVLSLLGVVLAFALMDLVILSYIFTCSLIIFGTTSTQMVIFIPKITKFKSSQNQVEDEDVTLTGTTHTLSVIEPSTAGGVTTLQLREELQKKTRSLQAAEETIRKLRSEIAALKTGLKGHSSADNI